MVIVNEAGALQYAWLEGETLDETCRGLRFRLVVGDKGGIVCDAITGTRELTAEQAERLATYAVVNTDPLEDPLPLVDANGRAARIVADPVHIQPVSRIIRLGPAVATEMATQVAGEVRLINPLAALPMIMGICAMAAGIVWLAFALMFVGAFTLGRKTKTAMPKSMYAIASAREQERRERLPGAVTRMSPAD